MSSPSGSADLHRPVQGAVAAVVPAWNEERTIGGIVRTLKSVAGIDEVIVVDDGSSDRTAEEAAAAGADQVLKLPANVGKGGALGQGARATTADVLFFCDADFIGLTPAHVERLLAPVREGRLMMHAGERDRGPVLAWFLARLPHISGERALRREVFERVPARFLRRFRVEIALEYACEVNRLPHAATPTLGITHVRKMQKMGFVRGLASYLSMIRDIAEASVLVRLSRKEFLEKNAH